MFIYFFVYGFDTFYPSTDGTKISLSVDSEEHHQTKLKLFGISPLRENLDSCLGDSVGERENFFFFS